MATLSGAAGTQNVNVVASSAVQAAIAQQILGLASAFGASPQIVNTTASATTALTSAVAIDTSTTPHVIAGSASVPVARVLLGGQNGAYATGGTGLSTVVAADNSSSAIVNNNPNGGLVAITGAGPNALGGFTGANQFVTGTGGQDVVFLDGAANNLTSGGSDAVLVGGPSTITATAGGSDNVLMTGSTSLSFVNASNLTSTITGAAGASISVGGTGATSVVAGTGTESFAVDTAAGNVTLVGSSSGADTFTFDMDVNSANGTARDVVSNFTANDTVQVHGYAGYSVQADPSNAAGAVLSLSDGSSVKFTDANVATVQAHLKVV